MKNESEALLIIQLKAGYNLAVARWFHDYGPVVHKFVASKISIEEDVEELVQEVFLACLRELVHFRGESSLQTWMLTIARHKVADFYRARYAKKVIHLVGLIDNIALPVNDSARDQIQAVQDALTSLPVLFRELLLAKYVDGKSVRQLAQEFAKTTKAIESLLFRARIQFKNQYVLALTQDS